MSNAITDGGIYHNGRTYAEHCAWLDSLVGDEYRIVYTPIGHLYSLATISHLKYMLLNFKMTAHERMQTLEVIALCIHGLITDEAVAAIEPCCETGRKMFQELNSLPIEKRTQAFGDGDIFRLLARLNPSLLAALRLCQFNQTVPEQPRTRAVEARQFDTADHPTEACHMSIIQSENKAHSATALLSEMTRQSDVAKAKATFVAGGPQAAYDAATRASDIAHYQRLQASAIANGVQSACFQEALWTLGAGPLWPATVRFTLYRF